MKRQVFQPNEEPKCLECGKGLAEGPARDYVVWKTDNFVSTVPQAADCGWCDARFTVFPIGNGADLKIVFTLR
jgi:hypothetical protein